MILLSVVDLLEKIIPKFRILHIIRNQLIIFFLFIRNTTKDIKEKYNLDNQVFFL